MSSRASTTSRRSPATRPATSTSTRACSGLRLVKKTVNQDDPTVYHLFYADEQGSAGADLTFFEYPGAAPGRAGAGMVHTIVWRVGARRRRSTSGRSGWPARACEAERDGRAPALRRPRGPGARAGGGLERRRAADRRAPRGPGRARAAGLRRRARLLGATPTPAAGCSRGRSASSRPATAGRCAASSAAAATPTTPPPERAGIQGAGTVHHVAWASTMDEHEAWRERVREAGAPADAGDRPLLLPLDLLPRAVGRAVRDRHARPRLRHRRGPGAPGRAALAAAEVRALARAGRADAHAAPEPARALDRALSARAAAPCASSRASTRSSWRWRRARQTGHVGGLAILDPSTAPGGELDARRTSSELIAERLPLLPPFRWRLAEVPLGLDYPYWVDDPEFDLDFHVRELALPPPGTDEQLAEQVARIVSRPLDRARPLWELYLIHGLESRPRRRCSRRSTTR